jgi:hypothetical protein
VHYLVYNACRGIYFNVPAYKTKSNRTKFKFAFIIYAYSVYIELHGGEFTVRVYAHKNRYIEIN